MLVEAKLKYTRTSPRKVRLVADLIRGRKVLEAEQVLQFTVKSPVKPMLKLLKSAVANAEHNFNLKKENLYIAEIKVDGGPIIKRFRPRARGSASPIQKKTSHILIVLKEIGGKETIKKEKTAEIKKVYQEEKPKEEISRSTITKTKTTEKIQTTERTKGEKKQIFRRKSI
jgi:large subunit ribosomal protein L22